MFNEAPFVINAFPGGEGEKPGAFLSVSDPKMVLTAMQVINGDLVLRLFNSSCQECTARVHIPTFEIDQQITLPASRFQTYIAQKGKLKETHPI